MAVREVGQGGRTLGIAFGGIGMAEDDGSARPRVLVVEDDDSVSKMLAICLALARFDVSRAASGREALSILESEPPEAVILDLGLPDGLGGAVLERLRGLPPGNLLSWVVVSVLDRKEVTNRYGPLGDRFFSKPLDPWEVIGRLGQLQGETREQPGPNRETS